MPLPSFFIPIYTAEQQEVLLDEDNSRHVVQVLRMKPGERLQLTDGRGHLLEGEILDDHKKHCRIAIRQTRISPPRSSNVTIAISPLKNTSRFEWFLEKATEIGVSRIVPLLCERTERQSTRHDRLRNILVSAMLQSQQTWLPEFPEPESFINLISHNAAPRLQNLDADSQAAARQQPPAAQSQTTNTRRLIAHCLEAPRPTTSLATWIHEQQAYAAAETQPATGILVPAETLILIGPEGDFTPKEVKTALAADFLPVSLGANRLRTETAGVVAATLLCIK